MNREILFRGKRRDNGEWAYGSLHTCFGETRIGRSVWNKELQEYAVEDKAHDLNICWILERRLPTDIGWNIQDSFIKREVDPDTVGQFTGLTDKNGKEIYEGDVVSYSQWNTTDGMSPMGLNAWRTGEVYFDNGKFLVKGNEVWDTLSYINIVVVGNIHENPELLSTEPNTKE